MLLFSLGFFVIGSALAGASQNLNMLIAARGEVSLAFDILMLIPQVAIQGFGSGGCLSVTEIIYADLVPLPERGKIQGITAT